ncbi:hypothetical protein [Pleurocapsa sp. PCC 7319]|uniref:hypothetical protein n=1 Tax=Pleurocapsa sp. PCC 7319 TaxID=118161 RepID=UPI00036DFA45|nr:hypothetical protein [Pleurocapsa sp. PCC 7319]
MTPRYTRIYNGLLSVAIAKGTRRVIAKHTPIRVQARRVIARCQLILIVGLVLFAPLEVKAQESIQLQVYPKTLKIAGTRQQKIERTLTITANKPLNPQDLQISFRDLYRTDELEIFPVIAQKAKQNIAQNSQFEYQLPLEFDLQQSSSMGEFSGEIVLRYQPQGENIPQEILLPITTKIKSNWWLPLLCIVLGTGIGTGLSWYRSQGRPRDEILVRVGRLRIWMQKDPQFDQSRGFKNQIEYQLNNVRSAVQEERWQDAESALTSAKIIWQKWNKGKTLLLPQLEYATELEQKVADINPHQPFKQQISYKIAKEVENAPDLDDIDQLRINLNQIASQINTYHQLQTQLEQVENLWQELAQVLPDEADEWQPQIDSWKQQFANLTLDDDMGNLAAELKNMAQEINEAIPRGRGVASEKSLAMTTEQPVIGDAPTGISFNIQKSLQKANLNLKIFAWSSYAIALLLLVGAGFSELYIDNETFGDRPFRDYFSLLAWGFGAEASREAIAKAIEGWGLAGLDKE